MSKEISDTDPGELAGYAAFAERLAEAARAAALPFFRNPVEIENKAGRGDYDPVTEADRAAETAMRALIEEAYPDHGIHGEEFPGKRGGDWGWTLDPIDGTRAFVCGLPTWTVLIALCNKGRPVLGVIDQPVLDERYIGYGGQAWIKQGGAAAPVGVRPCRDLCEAMLSTTDPFLFEGGEPGAFEHVRATARLTRYGLDAYAYAMLAAGRIDMVVESGLSAHDVQALVPVIEGAGGVITDWRGEPNWSGGQIVAAGDARIHAQALVSLRRAAAV